MATLTSTSLAAALAALCLTVGVLALLAGLRPGRQRLGRAADAGGVACTLLAAATWLGRWAEADHLPKFGTYEGTLSLVLAVLLASALGRHRAGPRAVWLWCVSCLLAAGLVIHGLGFDPTIYALTISERSLVVDLHALLAWLAFGALAGNAGFAVWRLLGPSPADDDHDQLMTRSLSVGFLLHSAMLAFGSAYAFLLFGRAWSFDPIETLGLVTWLAYGTLLHMRLFARWGGRRLAFWCLAAFVLLTVSYRSIVYFPATSSYHILDIDRRLHVTGDDAVFDER